MATSISTPPKLQFFAADGTPLVGGKLYSYAAGTTTPLATYTSSTGGTANTNPVILDSRGEANVWFGTGQYKLKLTSATDVDIWTVDNLNGVNQNVLDVFSASSGSSLIGYTQGGTGAVATTVQAKLRQTVSVKDFGAVGNGTTDDTAAIQLALNNSGSIYFPAGTYKISSALTITISDTSIRGEGLNTIIATNSLTADIFTLGDGTNPIYGLAFSDFTIWPSVVKTAGYAFNGRFVVNCQWVNVNVGSNKLYTSDGHRLFYGWFFDRFDTINILGGQCITKNDGIRMRGNADDSFSAELTIDNNLRFIHQNAAGACGIRIGGNCGGIYLRRLDVSLAETGIIIDTTLSLAATVGTKRNREIFIQGSNVDTCKKWGINQVAESVALLNIDNPWTASCGTDDDGSGGILIGGGTTVIPVVSISGSPYIYNNKGPGAKFEGGYVTIDGGQIYFNGRSTSGGNGIEFGATVPLFFSINGTDISFSGNATKGYGIDIPASLSVFSITAVTFHNNGQGAILNASGSSTSKIILGCLGYLTSNSSTASVATSNTEIVVSHGLSALPSSVLITPLGQPETGGWWVENITSTQFTIKIGATTTATRTFNWRAQTLGQ